MDKKNTRIKGQFSILFIFTLLLSIWQTIDYLFDIKNIILPNPYEILTSIILEFNSLVYHTGITMLEAFFGFLLSVVFGLFIASIFIHYSHAKQAFHPYLVALNAVPIITISPLFVVWFGNAMLAKIIMAALVCFFPILVSAIKGFSAIEQEFFDLFHSHGASSWQIFWKLRFPHSLSYLFPAFKTSATFSVVGAVVAEFTGSSQGIGHLIITASYYLDTSLVFASIVMISVAGILFYYLIEYFEKKIIFWQNGESTL